MDPGRKHLHVYVVLAPLQFFKHAHDAHLLYFLQASLFPYSTFNHQEISPQARESHYTVRVFSLHDIKEGESKPELP